VRDDFIGPRGVLRRRGAHGGHAHVQAVRVMMAPSHVMDGVSFVGFGVIHVHSRHAAVVHALRLLGLRTGLLRTLRLDDGRMVARNGREKDADNKERAEQHSGFRGKMDERAAGWHDNSPHTMIRMDGPADFRKEIRKCFSKTGREYSSDFQKREY
jgi:hypothetical protein